MLTQPDRLGGHCLQVSCTQDSTAPSNPLGAVPFTPAGLKTTGGRPLHLHDVSTTLCCTLHKTTGGRPPQLQDPGRGLPPNFSKPCRTLVALATMQLAFHSPPLSLSHACVFSDALKLMAHLRATWHTPSLHLHATCASPGQHADHDLAARSL